MTPYPKDTLSSGSRPLMFFQACKRVYGSVRGWREPLASFACQAVPSVMRAIHDPWSLVYTRSHSLYFTCDSNLRRYLAPTVKAWGRWPTLSALPYVGGSSGSILKLGTIGYPCGLSCTRAPQVSGSTSFTIRRISCRKSFSLLLAATKKEWETEFEKWRSQPSWRSLSARDIPGANAPITAMRHV